MLALFGITGLLAFAVQEELPALVPGDDVLVGRTFHLDSDVLGERRTIRVATPVGYDEAGERYPVLYVLDGEAHFPHVATTAGFLARQRTIPPLIVVALHNTDRERDLTPAELRLPGVPQRGAARFLDFLERELVPLVDACYRTQPLRVLAGHSHGGLFALHALAERPRLFPWVLSIDGPVHHQEHWLARRLLERLGADETRRGRLASVERTFGWKDNGWRALVDAAPNGFELARLGLPDETHESLVLRAVHDGLKLLFHDFSPGRSPGTPLAELEATYRRLGEAYGYDVPVPLPALLEAADDLVWAGRGAHALELVERIRRERGDAQELDRLARRAREVLDQPPPPESVDELLAVPAPRADEVHAFLGRWRGVVASPAPVEVEVRLWEQEGRVHGTTRNVKVADHPVDEEPRPLLLLRSVDGGAGLQWGVLNRKRPRAVAATTVRLVAADRCEGAQEMLGIVLPPRLREGVRPTPVRLERLAGD